MRKKRSGVFWLGESIDLGKSSKATRGIDKIGFFGDWSDYKISSSRFYIFKIFTLGLLIIFLARLFSLTLVEGENYRQLADSNRIRLQLIEAPRGKIYDRKGALLAVSETVFILEKDGKSTEITYDQARDLEVGALASENFEGGLGKIHREMRRVYPIGEAAAHVLGYTSRMFGEDASLNSKIDPNQSVGRLGLEELYSDFLTGRAGKKLIEVDTFGKKVSILGEEEPTSGRNLATSLDAGLQKVAYEALKKQAEKIGTRKGAIIVSSPSSGEILALASMPSFNSEDIGKSVRDLEKPFFNRAIQGVYPPGSVFKIVSALAGLESGVVSRDTEIEDVGEFELGGVKFSNWFFNKYGRRDGVLTIQRAIARSNDIYFYRLAEKTGLEAIRKMAIRMGFGHKTGIDLPSEAFGLVPDEVWKKSTYNDNWYLGDTMHLGIGQGFLLATPIQVNMMTSYIASGKLFKPHLVLEIGSKKPVEFKPIVVSENIAKSENLDLVRLGMREACKPGGTGASFFNVSYEVGCKTGTAEKELGNPHAWFTVYAPFNDPKIAVTVLVEDGGEGSAVAAPVAREIVDWWMANRR